MPIIKDCIFLTNNYDNPISKRNRDIIIAPLSEEDERKLDFEESIIVTSGKVNLYVTFDKVLTYGSIDFYDYNDLMLLDRLNLNIDAFRGRIVPSDYDYINHCCNPPKGHKVRYHQTWDNIKIVKYAYACLGKPDSIVIFKR